MTDRQPNGHVLLGRTAVVLLTTGLLVGLAVATNPLAARDEFNPFESSNTDPAESRVPSRSRSVKPEAEPRVRLSFFNTSWTKVFEHLAKETESELLLHDAPSGFFSRFDRRTYTREEAIRILNRELEPRGYRILAKNHFVIVLHDDHLRPRYPAPELAKKESRNDGGVIMAAATEGPTALPARAQPAREPSTRPTAKNEPRLLSIPVTIRDRRAAEVARALHTARGSRSELVERGPNGLPAMRVREPGPRGERRYVVEIDVNRDVLLVSAIGNEAKTVAAGLKQLEKHMSDGPARVVAAESRTADIARNLEPWLHDFNARRTGATSELALQLPGEEQPPAQPGGGQPDPAPGDRPVTAVTDLPTLVGALKGDVVIEAVEDLGVVILRGNQADVDAVMGVIKQIELLSRGSTPDILLLELQYVEGRALADLLNDVYGQLEALRERTQSSDRKSVSIIPVVRPNAILVLAPEDMLESIRKLAEELDKPIDPSSEVEIFRLRSAVPSQVVALVEDFYEERGGLGTRVQVAPDARTNSVVVQARPNDLEEITKLIRSLDAPRSKAVSRMQIFRLKNAVAEELVEVINASIDAATGATTAGGAGGAGSAAGQLREARSVVLEFLTSGDAEARRVRSGLLADVKVTADPRTNSLLVTAPEPSMELMSVLVDYLDKPTEAVAEIKVFTLENADATATADLLDTLFISDDQNGATGVQLAGADDAGSGLIPLRFSVDVRTNSVLAVGGAESLRVVEAIVLRLDESDARERKTTVVKLKNSPVSDVAAAINDFLTSQRELAQVDPALVSNVELLEREVIVVPEPVSNSLLISATPRYYAEIRSLVDDLDAAPPQVVIQALLVEVELDNTDELGVELGLQDDVLFGRSLIDEVVTVSQTNTNPNGVQTTTQSILSQSGSPGFLFGNPNTPLGNNLSPAANPSAVGSQGLSNFSLGRVNGDLGYGGLVLSASSASVNVLIRALAARRNVHILSRPQIRTLDNQLAQIQVGQQVPIVDGVNINTTGGATPIIRQDSAGIILTVTPRISPDRDIVMEVVAEKSQFDLNNGVPLFVDQTTGVAIESPVKDITTAQTTISIPNGQTVVLGGMITKLDDTIARKVPWLGDIPILGSAFRYDSTRTIRTELLIFLTPRVVEGNADSEIIKQIEAGRLHYIEEEAEAIHGPLFAVPPEAGPQLFPGADGAVMPTGAVDDADVPTTVMPATPSLPEPLPMPVQRTSRESGDSRRTDRSTPAAPRRLRKPESTGRVRLEP